MTKSLSTGEKLRATLISAALLAIIAPRFCRADDIRTIILRTTDDTDTISFDPSKISEPRLRELILLSPFVVDYINDMPTKNFSAAGSMVATTPDKQLIALPLELCIASDPAYSDCQANDINKASFLHNAEVNLEKSKRGLSWLQHLDHPRELDSVVRFLERSLSISIWIEETRLKYYSEWDERALKEIHDRVDPGQLCSDVFTKLEAAGSKQQKYEIVRFDWANCIIRAIDRQLGPYPVKEWNAFLESYAITENHKQQGPE